MQALSTFVVSLEGGREGRGGEGRGGEGMGGEGRGGEGRGREGGMEREEEGGEGGMTVIHYSDGTTIFI